MKRSQIEDIWPLSPLQAGLVFHAVYDGEGLDVYIGHWVLELDGPVDAARLRAAWEALLARHASLRACFRQRKTGETVQIIARLSLNIRSTAWATKSSRDAKCA